jgi:hypothetical protein
MTLKKEVRLRSSGHIFVPYPPGYKGDRTDGPQEDSFYISDQSRYLNQKEIELAQKAAKMQGHILMFSGAVLIDENDPLLQFNHNQLDTVEVEAELPNTRKALSGGTRSLYERVLIIRERGCESNAAKFLSPAL